MSCNSSGHHPLRWTTDNSLYHMVYDPHHRTLAPGPSILRGSQSSVSTGSPNGSPWDGFYSRWGRSPSASSWEGFNSHWGTPNSQVHSTLGTPNSGMTHANPFWPSPYHINPSSVSLHEPSQQSWNGTLHFIPNPPLPAAKPRWGRWSRDSPEDEIWLHPHLLLNPFSPHLSAIQWDLHQDPSTARHYSARHHLTPANLEIVATSPGVKSLVIDISHSTGHPLLTGWGTTISIEKLVPDKRRNITIGDILYAIYDYFQVPLTHHEVFSVCGSSGQSMDVMQRSLKTRCLTATIPEVEWKSGFRRVDILGDYRFFYGMAVEEDPSSSGIWRLKLMLGPSVRSA